MRHIEDRQAVHDLLDVALDAMVEAGDDWTVTFDVSSYGWNVRAGIDDEQDWRFYSNQTSSTPIEPDVVEIIKKHLGEVLADANPHD